MPDKVRALVIILLMYPSLSFAGASMSPECGADFHQKAQDRVNRVSVVDTIIKLIDKQDYEALAALYIKRKQIEILHGFKELAQQHGDKLKEKVFNAVDYVFENEVIEKGIYRLHYRSQSKKNAVMSIKLQCENGLYKIIKINQGFVL